MSLFLIGAGFNIDAGSYRAPEGTQHTYPLVSHVVQLCFNLQPGDIPAGKSIENLFDEALKQNDYEPLEKLAERLMECDWYLAGTLSRTESTNNYRNFLDKFSPVRILTFNYDSLPEMLLFHQGRWFPHDGYGISVNAEIPPLASKFQIKSSTDFVLHLHGSLCIYPVESEIRPAAAGSFAQLVRRERPQYGFDPDSLTFCFPPYQRAMSNTGRVPIEERVIAPVPDKAAALNQPFIKETYERAARLVRESGLLIAIGYSFNDHDYASYLPILRALADSHDKRLIVVAPEADRLAIKLRQRFSHLKITPIERTFHGWATESFRL